MYCKLCGKHLYETITFKTIFKLNYFIHYDCERTLNKSSDYIAFPLLDKLIYIDYLFEVRYDESEEEFLFEKYGCFLYKRLLDNSDWSICVFPDKLIDNETIILLVKLAEKAVLFLSVFNENFM